MPPKKSVVWIDFELTKDRKAKCKLCSAVLNYENSTSNLLKHLKGVHNKNVEQTQSKTLTDFGITKGKPLNNTRKNKITELVAEVVSENNLAFKFVESKKFRELLKYLEPNYQPVSASTIKSVIESKACEIKEKIKRDLKTTQHVSIITDCWTSSTNDSFMAVTCSYVNKEWKICSPVLETRYLAERHYAAYLKDEMKAVIQEWNIDNKVVAIVHDNASNIKSIAQSLNPTWMDIGCAAHTLQICINSAMGMNKNHPISRTINAASRLVAHFSHSTLATNELLKRQATMRDSGEVDGEDRDNAGNESREVNYKLVQYVRTRWNSVYEMFDRLLQLRWPLTAVLSDRSVTKFSDARTLDLTSEQWTLIENILPTLKKLKIANSLFCGEKYVSLSGVLPVLYTLIENHLEIKTDDTPAVKGFKKDLKSNIIEKFNLSSNKLEVTPYLLASALDPCYKRLNFVTSELKQEVYNELQKLVQHVKENKEILQEQKTEMDENPGPSKRQKLTDDELDFFTTVVEGKSISTSEDIDEIAYYISRPSIDRNNCPLEWWLNEEKNLPCLSILAKKYLGIPATSVAAERHFSAGGRTITKTRNRLLPNTTDTILFVNRNMDKY